MNWKVKLSQLEHEKKWDEAIEHMQEVIEKNPTEKDAYLCMNFLLMNLLVEEEHDWSRDWYYETLIKQYFNRSYELFSDDAEYLFYTGMTAVMSEWFFDITRDEYVKMLIKAMEMDPDNILYKHNYYLKPHTHDDEVQFLQLIGNNIPLIKELTAGKCGLSQYIREIVINSAKRGFYYHRNT